MPHALCISEEIVTRHHENDIVNDQSLKIYRHGIVSAKAT